MVRLSRGADMVVQTLMVAIILVIQSSMVVCRINWLQDGEFDFVIVGAGSAGCVLATRLSEYPTWRVLLLEAGGEEPPITQVPAFTSYLLDPNSTLHWPYQSEPSPWVCGGQPCTWYSGRCLGGSSSINAMAYIRGNPRDYDEWAAKGNTGWSYKDVLPYFLKSEDARDLEDSDIRYHRQGGYLGVEQPAYKDYRHQVLIDCFRELGFKERDPNAGEQEGVSLIRLTTRNGERQSTNTAYLKTARRLRPNLRVVTNARVIKVLIDGVRSRAYGVEFLINDNKYNIYIVKARKEVIVSAGYIHSPQLLQLSGIGPHEFLEPLGIPVIKNLMVGYNYMEHMTYFGLTLKSNTYVFKNIEDYSMYLINRTGPLTYIGQSGVTVFCASRNEWLPNLEFFFFPPVDEPVKPMPYYNRMIMLPVLLRPRSRGYVKIVSKDPLISPMITANYLSQRIDRDILIEGHRTMAKIAKARSFRQHGLSLDMSAVPSCTWAKFNSEAFWECCISNYSMSIFHGAGTCRMGPSAEHGAVVDSQLRVHGVQGLRVVDGSVMPTIVRGPLNAPVIMIAEKAADLIKLSYSNYY